MSTNPADSPIDAASTAVPAWSPDIDGPLLLASFTSHYSPTGPAETLLVRRIVAASLRIDLLERALDALMELGERRAMVDHLSDRFARDKPTMQVRDQPNWSAMLRRYDGNPGVPPTWGPDPTDDPTLDPDPTLCTLAYTLSGPRAATLMRHEATAERRLHASMRELHRLQADRRAEEKARNEPTALRTDTRRNKARSPHAEPQPYMPTVKNEPISSLLTDAPQPNSKNEPTAPPATAMQPVTGKNEPIAQLLSGTSIAAIKNEPISPPLVTQHSPADAAQTPRNEPIPAPPAQQRSTIAADHITGQSLWERPSSGLLESLIRNASRRAAGLHEHRPGAEGHASYRLTRRAKR